MTRPRRPKPLLEAVNRLFALQKAANRRLHIEKANKPKAEPKNIPKLEENIANKIAIACRRIKKRDKLREYRRRRAEKIYGNNRRHINDITHRHGNYRRRRTTSSSSSSTSSHSSSPSHTSYSSKSSTSTSTSSSTGSSHYKPVHKKYRHDSPHRHGGCQKNSDNQRNNSYNRRNYRECSVLRYREPLPDEPSTSSGERLHRDRIPTKKTTLSLKKLDSSGKKRVSFNI
jgi:hypothetical protein